MDNRREFIRQASLLAGGAGLFHVMPTAVAKALAIDPAPGTTFLDAEHIVILMQENRSFDHAYGTLQGVRGFNDPRAITLPGNNLVWLQSNKEGETYAPFRFDIKDTRITWMNSLPHSWSNQVDARNNGKYDQWLDSKRSGIDEYAPMPLTMGYYTREDIPFYYSLADAFTVCDQHFCSSLTGTTPNRLYFWTGTIREKPDENAIANVWNQDTDYEHMANWRTFPELLEANGVSWKIYQNEISLNVGFEGEAEGWLSNFGDSPIEWFNQFNAKFHPEYIANLSNEASQLAALLKRLQGELATLESTSREWDKTSREIDQVRKRIQINADDQKNYTTENFDRLSAHQKNLHARAFTTNRNDPHFHQLEALLYKEGIEEREVNVPKGDVLHQFRDDVKKGQLPTVSWLVAPENFSDHPASAWYGAWYISEALDILTSNPAIWKKTIFILTYDENDGYFDHVPPFVAPHPYRRETGFVSAGIHTGVEYVASETQQTILDHARESSIGLGYRVPLVIASPWSRGGWVNSEVFDHTSSLRFLEKFLSHKLAKPLKETNISEWRRTVCGDLTSVFRPYNREKIDTPGFLERDEFIESIHKAQFRNPPSNFRKLDAAAIARFNADPHASGFMPEQEKGIRPSSPLPYELYADGRLSDDKQSFQIQLKAGKQVFGNRAAGSPFHVYAPGTYQDEEVRNWSYAVAPGDALTDRWTIAAFKNDRYFLRVYGPNGFFREFNGSGKDPAISIACGYAPLPGNNKKLKGSLLLKINSHAAKAIELVITDNAYKMGQLTRTLRAGVVTSIELQTGMSFGWYDFTIRVKDFPEFAHRFAGRVETGAASKTDPFMGRVG